MDFEKLVQDAARATEYFTEDELERGCGAPPKREAAFDNDLLSILKNPHNGKVQASVGGYELRYQQGYSYRLWICTEGNHSPYAFVEKYNGSRWEEYMRYTNHRGEGLRGSYV